MPYTSPAIYEFPRDFKPMEIVELSASEDLSDDDRMDSGLDKSSYFVPKGFTSLNGFSLNLCAGYCICKVGILPAGRMPRSVWQLGAWLSAFPGPKSVWQLGAWP